MFHRHIPSFPITMPGEECAIRCLSCAAKRAYDWERAEAFGPWYFELPTPTKSTLLENLIVQTGIQRHEEEEAARRDEIVRLERIYKLGS